MDGLLESARGRRSRRRSWAALSGPQHAW